MTKAKFKGFGSLRTPADLLGKLRRDLELLQRHPNDQDLNFNFFVTAYHMIDWVLPGNKNQTKRKALENSEPLLQICSHLANGAKHFVAEAERHTSVSNVESGGIYLINPITPTGILLINPESGLFIDLDGDSDASRKFGDRITSPVLAKLVLEYWEKYLNTDP